MFVILLKFTDKKKAAADFMEAHNQWIASGFNDGVFLMVGSIKSGTGGAIIAQGLSDEGIEARVNQDPFVIEGIVKPEIMGIDPKKVDDRLGFILS
jgi:uncharacterized protein YciI